MTESSASSPHSELADRIWVNVDHIARGCRSGRSHEPTVYQVAIKQDLDTVRGLEEQLEVMTAQRNALHMAASSVYAALYTEEYARARRQLEDVLEAVSFPASRPLCPDCQGRGATDTETGIPCTRPSASCEECFTCGGTGSAPDPASRPS